MLHLYFAAFGAVAAANVIAVIAIAAMIKRTRSRFLTPMAVATTSQDGSQPPSAPTLEGLGRTSLFCVRGLP